MVKNLAVQQEYQTVDKTVYLRGMYAVVEMVVKTVR
jgi:hypothetical protein